ncbi:hypothetical protein HMPREF1574_00741 [Gardnerella pickettii JCP7659]|nr:hypothetical protein HMPREF1574_00741 [Gardnerella pickettii JCP7659]
MYDFQPFYDVIVELGKTLVPLAVPAICTWLILSWIFDLLYRS